MDSEGFILKTCSECRNDADCNGSDRCTPEYDILTRQGRKYCAPLGSVANGDLCPVFGLEGDGNEVCASNRCGIVDVGPFLVGVCGECNDNSDCDTGICHMAELSPDNKWIGAYCT